MILHLSECQNILTIQYSTHQEREGWPSDEVYGYGMCECNKLISDREQDKQLEKKDTYSFPYMPHETRK